MLFIERLKESINIDNIPEDILNETKVIDDLDIFPIPFILLFRKCNMINNYDELKKELKISIEKQKEFYYKRFEDIDESIHEYENCRNNINIESEENKKIYIDYINNKIQTLLIEQNQVASIISKINNYI